MTLTMRLLATTTLLSMAVGCATPETSCSAVSNSKTGDLQQDIVGTFANFGIDSPVFNTFRADGSWAWVEAPNPYAPDGFQGTGTWSVDGDEVEIVYEEGWSESWTAVIDETTLFQTVPIEDDGLWTIEHPRVQCRGYGF